MVGALTDVEALRWMVGIGFVCWCVLWVLEVGFLVDRWTFLRKARREAAAAEAEREARHPMCSGEDDCPMCGGELCMRHGLEPCPCNREERHRVIGDNAQDRLRARWRPGGLPGGAGRGASGV